MPKSMQTGRDDSIKVKVNIKTMPYPYVFFALQSNSMFES